jgi:hypothetical protein
VMASNGTCDEAADRIEALEKDAARLDWLAAHPLMTQMHFGDRVETGYCYIVSGHAGLTLRDILDTMQKHQP